jgi:two-component system LytT family sensor kinase
MTWIFIALIIILCVSLLWVYTSLLQERKRREKLAKQNTKLISENALLEADQLKFQLQPHTLNNILAHLKLTTNRLNKGLASLSETLEYIMYKGSNHYVSVEEEMNFIKEYLRLNELFIHEIDAIKEDYSNVNKNSKYYSSPCIPHLVTSYFIENAFKHGDIGDKDSLRISIVLTNEEFVLHVVNKMKQPSAKTHGGLGLSNMKKRLEILVSKKHEITNRIVDNEFHSTVHINF